MASDTVGDNHAGYTVTWENVNCRLKSGGLFGMGEKKVVHSLIDKWDSGARVQAASHVANHPASSYGFARPSESLAIIGPSGAGKTTLLGGLRRGGLRTGTASVFQLPVLIHRVHQSCRHPLAAQVAG